MTQVLREFWQQLQTFMDWIFRVIALIWTWSVDQIARLPWHDLGVLPTWKLLLMIAVGIVVAALIVWTLYALFSVGAHLIAAFVTLFGALVRTLPAIAAAGLVAAGAAYVINNVALPTESQSAGPPTATIEQKSLDRGQPNSSAQPNQATQVQ